MANYHVIKKGSGWQVKKEDAEKAARIFGTQRKAELSAKQFAANSGGGEVRIHGRNGKIRDSDTVPPANDPFPPRDKKH